MIFLSRGEKQKIFISSFACFCCREERFFFYPDKIKANLSLMHKLHFLRLDANSFLIAFLSRNEMRRERSGKSTETDGPKAMMGLEVREKEWNDDDTEKLPAFFVPRHHYHRRVFLQRPKLSFIRRSLQFHGVSIFAASPFYVRFHTSNELQYFTPSGWKGKFSTLWKVIYSP